MASSTRSSWKGTISLATMAIPVSLATTVREEREESIKTLCACHNMPIDQKERCSQSLEHGPTKIKGIKLADGTYQAIPDAEWAAVEEATRDDALQIMDVQPLSEFPMAFATGTQWVRAKKDDTATAKSLAMLVAALGKSKLGCVVKLCKSENQKLGVLWSYQGYALLTYVPFHSQFIRPGEQERAHMKFDIPESTVDSVTGMLIDHRNEQGFQWEEYLNYGLMLRQNLVDSALDEEREAMPPVETEVPDFMAAYERAKAAKEARERGTDDLPKAA